MQTAGIHIRPRLQEQAFYNLLPDFHIGTSVHMSVYYSIFFFFFFFFFGGGEGKEDTNITKTPAITDWMVDYGPTLNAVLVAL